MKILLVCFILFNIYLVAEFCLLSILRKRIPNRILVTGTRGKSSVTRLIAAGLNAGGIKTLAKVTGSAAQIIYPDGNESSVIRSSKIPSILEQKSIIKKVVELNAKSLVIESMAIRSQMMQTESFSIIHPQTIVICKTAPDHLDTTAQSIEGLVHAFSKTITEKSCVFTNELNYTNIIAKRCRFMDAKLKETDESINSIPIPLDKFSYLEHEENILLALSVCAHLGIEPQTALAGMINVTPDPGALKTIEFISKQHPVTFIQAFAANDPQSLTQIYNRLSELFNNYTIILINTRHDRPSRNKELLKFILDHPAADEYIITGNGPNELYYKQLLNKAPAKILKFEEITNYIENNIHQPSTIFGIGNYGNVGKELTEYIKKLPGI